MNSTILQIPIAKQMRIKATKIAKQEGFSSLQEVIRLFLKQFSAKKVEVSFTPKVLLSEKNEKQYQKMIEEVRSGKIKTKKFSNSNIDNLMT